MEFTGVLKKMKTQIGSPVNYFVTFKGDFLNVNQLLDHRISIHFKSFECLNCGKDKKIWRQGLCYDCFQSIPQAGEWIMKPELSKAHLDREDRDLAYEKRVQLKPHIVYLANSSNVKVGVTRKSQVPTRWIDQGAHEAIEIVETPNRYLAGITEVALKEHVADKTKWRKMLQNDIEEVDLIDVRDSLKQYIPEEAQDYYLQNNKETEIDFPVLQYPEKLKSLNLRKTMDYEGTLKGIKGQYLIFDDNRVFNVRNHSGFVVDIKVLNKEKKTG